MYYTPGNRTHGSENVQISNAEKNYALKKKREFNRQVESLQVRINDKDGF